MYFCSCALHLCIEYCDKVEEISSIFLSVAIITLNHLYGVCLFFLINVTEM